MVLRRGSGKGFGPEDAIHPDDFPVLLMICDP